MKHIKAFMIYPSLNGPLHKRNVKYNVRLYNIRRRSKLQMLTFERICTSLIFSASTVLYLMYDVYVSSSIACTNYNCPINVVWGILLPYETEDYN